MPPPFECVLVAKCEADGLVNVYAEANDVLLLKCADERTAVLVFSCPKCGTRGRNVVNEAAYLYGGSMQLEKFLPARSIDLPPRGPDLGLRADDVIDLGLTDRRDLYERIVDGCGSNETGTE